jgi:two-component system, OmpR family, response regulator
MRIAMVEDDSLFAASLGATLEEWGFRVDVIETGAAALKRFERHDLDAAIVDIGLPDMDGIEVIAGARELGMWAPILVASARADLGHMVRALEAGADDYVIKPFTGAEINARLGALGRRAAAPRWAPLACGKIILSAEEREATVDGLPVKLSPREHALLEILLRRRGQIVSRHEILERAFGYDFPPGTNLVDVHVAHLRHKLENGGVTIETIRGVGFCLSGEDETQPEPIDDANVARNNR